MFYKTHSFKFKNTHYDRILIIFYKNSYNFSHFWFGPGSGFGYRRKPIRFGPNRLKIQDLAFVQEKKLTFLVITYVYINRSIICDSFDSKISRNGGICVDWSRVINVFGNRGSFESCVCRIGFYGPHCEYRNEDFHAVRNLRMKRRSWTWRSDNYFFLKTTTIAIMGKIIFWVICSNKCTFFFFLKFIYWISKNSIVFISVSGMIFLRKGTEFRAGPPRWHPPGGCHLHRDIGESYTFHRWIEDLDSRWIWSGF